ncbi:MAG TPA: CocE/NonD family hydrolase [Gemmatimonadales bacterium]|nr:CocE/NonD family hydrolase [Gemmatimonadales bacterium]
MRWPILCLLVGSLPSYVAAQAPADSAPGFTVREEMIPMRDGARLHTLIYRPAGHSEPLPFMMMRTPYGIAGSGPRLFHGYLKALAAEGYIFVLQDIRGRYGSEGQFVMNRPLDPKGVDESTDTYDTVAWLLAHVADNNGRVGVLGISYPGWLAAMAGIHSHPAVRAVSPQAPMTDTWMGDDFFHHGAFRLSYGFEYSSSLELSNDQSVPVPIERYDTYGWYLDAGSLASLTQLLDGRVPTWTNFVAHPTYDSFWKAKALPTYLTRLAVPTLTVGGWWDQEDFYGALKTYETLEPLDTAGINFLVMGPWNHGEWGRAEGDSLGRINFVEKTGAYFREKVQAPWFAYWLKDKGQLPLQEALVFVSGSNHWQGFESWPPKVGVKLWKLFLSDSGRLALAPSQSTTGNDAFVSDPAHPVPYRPRPVQLTYDRRGSDWYTWLVDDQRFVDGRPDVLTWQTGPLTGDITIAGPITAKLYASTTGEDADWVVKLIDVYPDSSADLAPRMQGYELMVASEILRGRYRDSWEHPSPLKPGQVTRFTVDLHEQAYTFLKGHRIMVQVQSTWFPLYDRNPQTWVPNIFLAKPTDFRPETHRVYRTARYPSDVEVEVLEP